MRFFTLRDQSGQGLLSARRLFPDKKKSMVIIMKKDGVYIVRVWFSG